MRRTLLLLACLPLIAQAPEKLTLERALEIADQSNLDLATARLRRAQSLARVQIARTRPNPTVSFDVARDSPHQGLTVEQPFELGSKRRWRIDVAKQEGVLTDVEISALARQIRKNTREAYYDAVQARAETEFLGRAQKLAERLRQIAQERFEAGAVARLEVIRADADVARAQAEYQISQQREKISLSQLNALLNRRVGQAWELSRSLEDPVPPVTLDELVQKAYALNPELQHLAQEQKVEQSRLSLLKAERIPNLSVNVGTDFNAPGDFQVGPRAGLAVTVPLFARNQGEIAESVASQRILESQVLASKRSVAGSVERAWFELQALATQVQIYRQKLLPNARELESLAEESYRAGKTDILFVLDAQRNMQEVEHNYLSSLAALQDAWGKLEESVGGPLP